MDKRSVCKQCRKDFVVTKNAKGIFCSQPCYRIADAFKIEKINCENCNKEFVIHATEFRKRKKRSKEGKIFCSHFCALNFYNRSYNKKQIKYCVDCQKEILQKSTRCNRCQQKKRLDEYGEKTLEEARYKLYKGSGKWIGVRKYAQKILDFYKIPKKCGNCSWNHNFHVAHIKAISSFSLQTQVKIVNALSNLKYFCPNCHWLFDHKPELMA